MKVLAVLALAVACFAAGFTTARFLKADPAPPVQATDYRRVAEALATENASLAEEIAVKDKLIGVLQRQIEEIEAAAALEPL